MHVHAGHCVPLMHVISYTPCSWPAYPHGLSEKEKGARHTNTHVHTNTKQTTSSKDTSVQVDTETSDVMCADAGTSLMATMTMCTCVPRLLPQLQTLATFCVQRVHAWACMPVRAQHRVTAAVLHPTAGVQGSILLGPWLSALHFLPCEAAAV